jgi:RHS repeat-associated protein
VLNLGSSNYITNIAGEVSQHTEYFAFGETFVEEHKGSNNSPYKFNGKELDNESGLYYYGARYYDPRISIWASVDPLAEKTLDSYGYCYQNPIDLVDPSGKKPEPSGKGWTRFWGGMRTVGGVCQVVAGAVGGAATSWTGVGAVVGVVAVVHGADDVQAGLRQLWTGEETESLTYKGIKASAKAAGASENTASTIATFSDIGLSFVGGGAGSFKLFSRGGKVAEFTVAESKFNYFFGKVIEGAAHNIQRSAQNLKDLTTLGIKTETQLIKIFGKTLSEGTEISRATNEYGTTINKILNIGEKGQIVTSFFYEAGDLSKVPKVTTIIPKIFK